ESTALQEPRDVGRAGDANDQVRRRHGQSVDGRRLGRMCKPRGAHALVRAIGRSEQARAPEQAKERVLHAGNAIRAAYTGPMTQAPALPRGFELPLEPRLPRIGSVDQVAVEGRAGELAKRSIKREAKLF